jgi:hypothetical protein
MLILFTISAILLIYGLIGLRQRAYASLPQVQWHSHVPQPRPISLAEGEAMARHTAVLGQGMAEADLRGEGGRTYLTDVAAIVAKARPVIALTWPGLDPSGVAYLTLVTAYVGAYIGTTDPVAGNRYAQAWCAMVGTEG